MITYRNLRINFPFEFLISSNTIKNTKKYLYCTYSLTESRLADLSSSRIYVFCKKKKLSKEIKCEACEDHFYCLQQRGATERYIVRYVFLRHRKLHLSKLRWWFQSACNINTQRARRDCRETMSL